MHTRRPCRIVLSVLLVLLSPMVPAQPPVQGSGLYLVEFTTGPGWDTAKPPSAQAGFAGHGANLRRLRDAGVLLYGARYGDKGVVLLRVADEAAARAELAADPAVAAGTFNAAVFEFRPFYPGEVPANGHAVAPAEGAAAESPPSDD